MLLTLSAPAKSEFDFKTPHDFPPRFTSATKRQSPPPYASLTTHPSPLPPPPPPSAESTRAGMSTPHRGLPPPAAMTLPDPARAPPITPSLGQMPSPGSQWEGAEESMRNCLAANAEEDRRKQEEERTRQETLRLEQRKIESTMLRESITGGVPPHMVPIIFAGIGGANLANFSVDWLQQYAAQLQSSQQQVAAPHSQQMSPDTRRESRIVSQQQYGAQTSQQSQQSGVPPAPQVLQGQSGGSFPPYSPSAGAMSPNSRSRALQAQGPTSAPRSSTLPRLTTNEMQMQQPPTLHSAPVQEPAASSPSIYFHHWVPPSSQGGSGSSKDQPATPSGKSSN